MFNAKEPRKLPRLALLVIAFAAVYSAGFSRGVKLVEADADKRVEVAKATAYQAGLKNQDWREHAKSDPALMNELAYNWWFGLSHKDRRLDPTCKPKRL